MIKKIICFFFGHEVDWKEYDKRMEIEGHHSKSSMVYCPVCNSYWFVGK